MEEQIEPITILVNPGTASAEQIADLLSDLSDLYVMIGGSGIDWTVVQSEAD